MESETDLIRCRAELETERHNLEEELINNYIDLGKASMELAKLEGEIHEDQLECFRDLAMYYIQSRSNNISLLNRISSYSAFLLADFLLLLLPWIKFYPPLRWNNKKTHDIRQRFIKMDFQSEGLQEIEQIKKDVSDIIANRQERSHH